MTNTIQKIHCPACGKEMEKVFIDRTGATLDICTEGCGGIFFDNREFKDFDEPNEDISQIIEKVQGKTFVQVNEDNPRVCPSCGAKMVKNYSSAKKEVQVDDCYKCGGKFLDHGELLKIRQEYQTEEERSEDVMKVLYDTVGKDIRVLDAQRDEARKNRSPLAKLMWAMIDDTTL